MTNTAYHVDPDFDSSGYGLVDFGVSGTELTAERWLLLWVILQALVDIGMIMPAHGNHRYGKRKLNQVDYEAAVTWFLDDRRDFFMICEMAGANAFAIRGAVQKFMLGKLAKQRVV
jgi:hypothetical protein